MLYLSRFHNTGDLTISVNVLYNYLEANSKVPWEDLRYLFGEIMYGGHITDDWDRVLCRTYLEEFLHPDQVVISGGCFLSFRCLWNEINSGNKLNEDVTLLGTGNYGI